MKQRNKMEDAGHITSIIKFTKYLNKKRRKLFCSSNRLRTNANWKEKNHGLALVFWSRMLQTIKNLMHFSINFRF